MRRALLKSLLDEEVVQISELKGMWGCNLTLADGGRCWPGRGGHRFLGNISFAVLPVPVIAEVSMRWQNDA